MSKIKVVVFDLDGVLVDSRPLHYHAFNRALVDVAGSEFSISLAEHVSTFDGRPTSVKLKMMTEKRGLSPALHDQIWKRKQELTLDVLEEEVKPNVLLQDTMRRLNEQNLKLFCASNAIMATVTRMLEKLGIKEFFSGIFSNEEVSKPKPYPEIYMRLALRAGVSPKEVLVVEDSPLGRRAALEAGCHLFPVEGPEVVTFENVNKYINLAEQSNSAFGLEIPWIMTPRMAVLFPIAGDDALLRRLGFQGPKCLVRVRGYPMIELVIRNLNVRAKHVFVVQGAENARYNFDQILPMLTPKGHPAEIVEVDGATEGQACTCLAASRSIDNDLPLLIASGDQVLDWDMHSFMYKMQNASIDGGLAVFDCPQRDSRFSYAEVDPDTGFVKETREKDPFTDMACVGVFYFRRGSDFVRAAREMILAEHRVKGAFWVAPCYNYLIKEGKKIVPFPVRGMWNLGTVDGIGSFEKNYMGPI